MVGIIANEIFTNQIAWGGDTWTSEEATGAVLAWKHVIASALSEMLDSGYLDLQKAAALAKKLMDGNNAAIYGIKLD